MQQHTQAKPQPVKLSRRIRDLWRETEDILTAATGPLLIIASAIAVGDIFSNHAFSMRATWLPIAWALARALAVTIWLGASFGFYLTARRRGESGFWWLMLALSLFAVDLQTALLYAFQVEHISNYGELALLNIPPIDWALEQALLGVILIAVHRAVDHETHEQQLTQQLIAQPTQPAHVSQLESPLPPVAAAAFYPFPTQTRITGYDTPSYTNYGATAPASQGSHPRRSDAGRPIENKAQRIERIMAALRVEPNLTKREIAARFSVSEATAYNDSREARRRLEMEV